MKKPIIFISALATLALASSAVVEIFVNSDVKEANASVGSYSTNASTYYSGITATSGTSLLGQLHDLMCNTHQTYTSYDDCKTPEYVYAMEPGTSSSYVTDFYTQQNIAKSWGSGAVGTWNREHVWCQSLSIDTATSNQLWGQNYGGSDLHHIRPIESTLNSTRNNHPYGELSDFGLSRDSYKSYSKDTNKNQLYHGGYTDGSNDVFEPLDSVKGDVARIIMYVYTHYSSYKYISGSTDGSLSAGSSTGKLSITNVINTKAGTEASAWEMLLEWNSSDPVSSAERVRNEKAAYYQGNRNPFIDNNSYADAIWGDGTASGGDTVAVTGVSLNKTSLSLSVGNSETLTATVAPSNATNKTVTWSSNKTNIATVSSSGKVTAVAEGTATITVTTSDNNKTATCEVTVTDTSSSSTTDEVYELVTDGVTVGDEIIIANVSSGSGYVLKGETYSSYYLKAISATISNNRIVKTSDMSSWTVGGSSNAYTLYDGSNYLRGYVSGTHYNIAISNSSSATGLTWSISSYNSGYSLKSNLNVYASYYLYKDTTPEYTGSQYANVLYLYKKITTAQQFAETFINAITCDSTGNNAPTLSTSWSNLASIYNNMGSITEQNLLKNATYTVSGSNVSATDGTNAIIALAMSKYDIIVGKYSYNDFISRKGTGAYGYSRRSINNTSFLNSSQIPTIVVIMSLVTVTCLGGYFYLRKKKEQ